MALLCPLCMGVNFPSEETLLYNLISSATKSIVCPVCREVFQGFDKFTVHLCAHLLGCDSDPLILRPDNITTMNDKFKNLNLCTQMTSKNSEPEQTTLNLDFLNTNAPHVSTPESVKCSKTLSHETAQAGQLSNVITGNSVIDLIILGDTLSNEINSAESLTDNSNFSCSAITDKSDTVEQTWADENNDTNLQSTAEITDSFTKTSNADLLLMDDAHADLPNLFGEIANQLSSNEINILSVNSFQKTDLIAELTTATDATTSNTMQNYEVTVNQKESVDCSFCSISFSDPKILLLHHKLAHGGKPRSISTKHGCTICGEKFNTRGGLIIHQKASHADGKSWYEKRRRNSLGQLSQQLFSSEEQNGYADFRPSFTCDLCSKVFKKENYLAQHLKTHDEKRWNCDVCGKLFSNKYFLRYHKRLHTGEMPYTCTVCEKHFTFQQSYFKHMSYHSNEKPYVCKDCGKSFKELSTLYNHQRIHTGEKPFSCDICGKNFRQRVSYLIHSRIHTGLKPYTCSKCQRSFRYKVMLRNHKCVQQTEVVPDNV